MDIKKSTGALAFFKKLLRKVIVWETLETPKHSIPYSDEYIPTPTIAYKYLRGRRLNFEDPTLFKEPSDISEDESDSDDELTPQRVESVYRVLDKCFISGHFLDLIWRKMLEKLQKRKMSSTSMRRKNIFSSRLCIEKTNMELICSVAMIHSQCILLNSFYINFIKKKVLKIYIYIVAI